MTRRTSNRRSSGTCWWPPTSARTARALAHHIEELERGLVSRADLCIASSRGDLNTLLGMGAKKAILCRNGVYGPTANPASCSVPDSMDLPERFLLMVGSDYLPNVQGFSNLLLAEPNLFFLPPEPAIVICGAMCNGVATSQAYQTSRLSVDRCVCMLGAVSDESLAVIIDRCHGFILSIEFGGGSHLKTAEALYSGKWVIAASVAMRGFEEFGREPGVVVADDPKDISTLPMCPLPAPKVFQGGGPRAW